MPEAGSPPLVITRAAGTAAIKTVDTSSLQNNPFAGFYLMA
jgi:hypothetical protein